MKLKELEGNFTVCKAASVEQLDLNKAFYFVGKTDEELSLVCKTEDVPKDTTDREDGWRGFRIEGVLDFSLVGILSKLSGILAENGIGIFAVSTFNTDYIFVKEEDFAKAQEALTAAGYRFV
ncbi:MAG: ACT domain-containing protein [Clostridia bacterium]|nr:ACT domain-containing protein [Clostridia bacterium]